MTLTAAPRDEREEFRKFEEWCQSQHGFSSTNLMLLDGRDMRKAWLARAAIAEAELAEFRTELTGKNSALVVFSETLTAVSAERDELRAELERVKADNRAKNGSMKAFGEQIAKLQRAVKNREKMLAKAAIGAGEGEAG